VLEFTSIHPPLRAVAMALGRDYFTVQGVCGCRNPLTHAMIAFTDLKLAQHEGVS